MEFVGIDVGGERKGFHIAFLDPIRIEITWIRAADSIDSVVELLRRCCHERMFVAIDCPPSASILGKETRSSERWLHKSGVRVQWTRRSRDDAQEWMVNGEHLWEALRINFPEAELIEAFPRAVTRLSQPGDIKMSLQLFGEDKLYPFYKDCVDACLCADVALRFSKGTARQAPPREADPDELGPIWY